YDHGIFGAFPSYEAKYQLEIHFHVEKRNGLFRGVSQKELGEKSANENGLKFILRFNSFFVEFVQPCFCLSILVLPSNWFPLTRVKWLPLIANSFAVLGIVIAEPRVRATTRSKVHMGSSSISKNIKKVTEVIDVENWRVDNSRVLRWIVSLIEWNFSFLSMKSSIQ
nr:hypothetical protein [Tanacetum cinerariifolium]